MARPREVSSIGLSLRIRGSIPTFAIQFERNWPRVSSRWSSLGVARWQDSSNLARGANHADLARPARPTSATLIALHHLSRPVGNAIGDSETTKKRSTRTFWKKACDMGRLRAVHCQCRAQFGSLQRTLFASTRSNCRAMSEIARRRPQPSLPQRG